MYRYLPLNLNKEINMAATNQYPKLGHLTIIPAADLLDITSAANAKSPARLGDAGFGKAAGQIYVRDAGSAAYSLVFPVGSAAASVWKLVDNSATYTPV
jgi:hypothetical protein